MDINKFNQTPAFIARIQSLEQRQAQVEQRQAQTEKTVAELRVRPDQTAEINARVVRVETALAQANQKCDTNTATLERMFDKLYKQ